MQGGLFLLSSPPAPPSPHAHSYSLHTTFLCRQDERGPLNHPGLQALYEGRKIGVWHAWRQPHSPWRLEHVLERPFQGGVYLPGAKYCQRPLLPPFDRVGLSCSRMAWWYCGWLYVLRRCAHWFIRPLKGAPLIHLVERLFRNA
eukprot:g48620.t1